IARTAANIKNGGRTPVSGIVHSLSLVLVVLFLMPLAKLIPMPCIAAILFQVAYNMSGWKNFVNLCKASPLSDVLVLVTTFLLTVIFDLVVAIEVGIVLAAILFMKRMSDETQVEGWREIDEENDPESINLRQLPDQVMVYEISGPMFFAAAGKILDISIREDTKVLVLRMRSVTAIDATALHNLERLYDSMEAKGIKMVFSHVNPQPMKAMKKARFDKKVGEANFCEHIDEALEHAKKLASS
ncbi:MAG: STAS domain-containing protein, partial [Lachnospiraceae bacterium]|nr:STAS domain-containing protein [Lachnospiraceae bacterium]